MLRPYKIAAILAGGAVLAMALQWYGPPPGERVGTLSADKSVLLISIDTLRADHLGMYGYHRDTSPQLDAFADGGFIFDRALAPAPNTPPSQMSMMTSLTPGRHGFTGDNDALAPEHATLAELLQDRGLQTAGFVDGGYLRGRFGFARGFDTYDDRAGGIARIAPRALAWLDDHGDRPFFVFVHCYDVHAPYEAPAPFRDAFHEEPYSGGFEPTRTHMDNLFQGKVRLPDEEGLRHIVARYDEGILYTDAQIGAFLSALDERGLLDNTTVIITSDHGEEFLEHGSFLHWQTYYQPNLRVPLIVRLPERLPGTIRVPEHVELIDILPTVLDLLGLASHGAAQGRSLAPLLATDDNGRGDDSSPPRESDRHTLAWSAGPLRSSMRTIVKGRYQLIYNASHKSPGQLFDIEADPYAGTDLAAGLPNVAHALRVEATRAYADNVPMAESDTIEIDDETREQLRALGYLE